MTSMTYTHATRSAASCRTSAAALLMSERRVDVRARMQEQTRLKATISTMPKGDVNASGRCPPCPPG